MRIFLIAVVLVTGVFSPVFAWAEETAPSAGITFFNTPHGVPVTADTFDEGKAVLETLPPEEREKLLAEGIVIAEAKQLPPEISDMRVGYVVAEAPRAEIWKHINSPGKWDQFLPRVEKTKHVKRTGNTEYAWYQIKVSFVTLEFQAEHRYRPEVSRMAWSLDPGFDNDLRQQDGFYNIYALDEKRTLIEYGTRVKTSPLVPSFVENYLVNTALPDALVAMKKYMDSGGTYRKE